MDDNIDWSAIDADSLERTRREESANIQEAKWKRTQLLTRRYFEAFDRWKMWWGLSVDSENQNVMNQDGSPWIPEIQLGIALGWIAKALKESELEESLQRARIAFKHEYYLDGTDSRTVAIQMRLLMDLLSKVLAGTDANKLMEKRAKARNEFFTSCR